MNNIYNVNDIVKVIETDMVGKIIDVKVNGQNTLYLIVFDNGTFDSFLAKEIILNAKIILDAKKYSTEYMQETPKLLEG